MNTPPLSPYRTALHRAKRWKALGTAIAFVTAATSGIHAASINSNWTGNGDGTSWSDADNWSPDTQFPNNGSDIYHSFIANGGNDLSITTQGNLTLSGLTLTQDNPGGSLALKLGGDLTLANAAHANGSGIYNTSGTNAGVSIDLNGYHFSTSALTASYHNFHQGTYSVGSGNAAGTGTFSLRNIDASANIAFNDSITVRLTTDNGVSALSAATWSSTSTLVIATGTHIAAESTVVSIGNLTVGETDRTSATTFSLRDNSVVTVRGDVVLNSFSGAADGAASKLSFSTTGNAATLRVMGSFTDHGTASYYGSNASAQGTIAFVGGAGTERTVDIGRQSLRNHFTVGDATAVGNIGLANHLTTTRSTGITGGSRLNLNTYTLTSATLLLEEGATLAMRRGGGVSVTDSLTLDGFHLELLGDWSGWTNGDDLLLMTYSGTLSGEADLLSIIAPAGFTYDALTTSDGQVVLSNVAFIPEPGTIGLLIGAVGISLAWARRRKELA